LIEDFVNVYSLGAAWNAKNEHGWIHIGTSQNHSSVRYNEIWRRKERSGRKSSRDPRGACKEQSRPSNRGRHRAQQRRKTHARNRNQPQQRKQQPPMAQPEQARPRKVANNRHQMEPRQRHKSAKQAGLLFCGVRPNETAQNPTECDRLLLQVAFYLLLHRCKPTQSQGLAQNINRIEHQHWDHHWGSSSLMHA
jgi:hypothetical protein